jgi:hypothetical protein
MQCRFVEPVKILEHDKRRSLLIEEDVDEHRERAGTTELGVNGKPVIADAVWTEHGEQRSHIPERTRPGVFEMRSERCLIGTGLRAQVKTVHHDVSNREERRSRFERRGCRDEGVESVCRGEQ